MRRALVFLAAAGAAFAADYQAGTARVKITPEGPIWLTGYASRTHASEGVVCDLWAKALAISDSKRNRVVIVTTDIIGLPRSISDTVAARAAKQYGLRRNEILLNSSHTHTGPALPGNLDVMLPARERERIAEYGRKLTDSLVTVIGAALGDLKPADLFYSEANATFGVNRRQAAADGVRIGVNPEGPRDTAVPVLVVRSPRFGPIRAVLFGYACHNTTLTGEHYQITGDYAGFAQLELEKMHPGTTAMFLQLCGADINPHPRGTLELAKRHGSELAAEVQRVLGQGKPVRGKIRSAFRIVEPAFAPHTRETFEKMLSDSNPFKVRNAEAQLRAYDAGHPIRRVPYPVQAIRFGNRLTVFALGGEVVSDYALRIKRDLRASREPIIVAGYSNDVMCYIPSAAVLKAGGYEPVDSMTYYGLPGPFTEDIEETVMGGVRDVAKRVGR